MAAIINEDLGSFTTLRPAGNVVAAAVPELREMVRAAMASGARRLILDFSGVETVDSDGLTLLIAAHNSLCRLGGRLTVVNACRDIVDLLRFVRLHDTSIETAGSEAR